jgi:hypothetical protein
MGLTAGVRFLAWGRYFSLFHSVQTGSEAHPASYPMGTGGSFPGSKRPCDEPMTRPTLQPMSKNKILKLRKQETLGLLGLSYHTRI